MEKTDLSLRDVLSKAERYCSTAEHCEMEVVRKLYQWGAMAHKDAVVAHLRDHGYLDDDRYCRAFAHDHLLFNHWSPLKIRMALRARGLPYDSIRLALADCPADDEEDTDF